VLPGLETGDLNLIHYATTVPKALMNAASAGWDMACRTLGACRAGGSIDREFGDMVMAGNKSNGTCPKLFSYVRYDPELTDSGLAGLKLAHLDPERVRRLDATDGIADLQQIGQAYAARMVSLDHIGTFAK